MNFIIYNPVTNKAVQWAKNIYGLIIGQLKSHTTRRQKNPVVDTIIDIPDELLEVKNDVTITMDGLTIKGLNFFSTISLHIYYRTMHYMPNITVGYYQRSVNNINSVYKRGAFDLTKIRRDNEFQAALDPIVAIYDPPIKVNHANPQEHVPQAERKIDILKNIFARSITYYRLTGCHANWLSTWDLNWLGSQICFQKSTGF